MDLPVRTTQRAARCLALRSGRGDFAAVPKALEEVVAWIAQRGLTPSGPAGMRFLDDPTESGLEDCDWEAFVELPVTTRARGDARIEIRHEPPVHVATTVHVGPYHTLGARYRALRRWCDTRGYRWAGPPEEVYETPAGVPDDQVRTEVRVPIEERD